MLLIGFPDEATVVIFTALSLGLLHTLMPCEDKTVFIFYAYGMARDWKQAVRILNFYAAGLMLMNILIGIVISLFGYIFYPILKDIPYLAAGLGSLSLIISGSIMLYQVQKNKYWPHKSQLEDLADGLSTLRRRKRTGFLLGMLAGIPPCLFEIGVYTYGASISASAGFGNGIWVFLFFGIGTWMGLIPLTIFISTRKGKNISKSLNGKSFMYYIIQERFKIAKLNRINKKGKKLDKTIEQDPFEESMSKNNSIEKGIPTHQSVNELENPEIKLRHSKWEMISAIILILIGLIGIIFSIFGIDIFLVKDPSDIILDQY